MQRSTPDRAGQHGIGALRHGHGLEAEVRFEPFGRLGQVADALLEFRDASYM